MEDSKRIPDWQNALVDTYQEFTREAIDHIPQLLGALALLLIGWVVAWLLRQLIRKLIRGFDALLQRTAQKRGLESVQVRSYARLGENIVFWSVLLFFVAASASLLDWKIFAGVSAALILHLPKVLTGLLIILAGFALSGVARSAVARAAESTDIAQSGLLSRIAQVTVVLTSVVVGVEQLGINVAFLTTTLIVVTGVLFGGAALAFAFGAKCFVANVIGVQTVRKHFQLGQLIKIGDTEGHLLEVTPAMMVLDTQKGRAIVPAKLFHEQIGHIIAEPLEETSSLMSRFLGKKGDDSEST